MFSLGSSHIITMFFQTNATTLLSLVMPKPFDSEKIFYSQFFLDMGFILTLKFKIM